MHLRAGLIQGRRRNRNTEYVAESVVDVQSFGAHCMTLYAHGQLQSQNQWVVVKTEVMAE